MEGTMKVFFGGKEIAKAQECKITGAVSSQHIAEATMPRLSWSVSCTAKYDEPDLLDKIKEQSYDVIMQCRGRKHKRIPRKVKKEIKWSIKYGFSVKNMYKKTCRNMVKFLRNVMYNVYMHNMRLKELPSGGISLEGTMPAVNLGEYVLPKDTREILKSVLLNHE